MKKCEDCSHEKVCKLKEAYSRVQEETEKFQTSEIYIEVKCKYYYVKDKCGYNSPLTNYIK